MTIRIKKTVATVDATTIAEFLLWVKTNVHDKKTSDMSIVDDMAITR